jgi:hypothetical protein
MTGYTGRSLVVVANGQDGGCHAQVCTEQGVIGS